MLNVLFVYKMVYNHLLKSNALNNIGCAKIVTTNYFKDKILNVLFVEKKMLYLNEI